MKWKVRKKIIKYSLLILGLIVAVFVIWNFLYYFFINTKPNHYALKYCNIETTELDGRCFYSVTPKANSESKKIIFYIHGGAYVGGMTRYHWQYIADLCEDTGAKILIPDYPLAPKAKCTEIIEFMSKVYEIQVQNYGTETLYVMGDSAGGGLALSLMEYENEDVLPRKIILLSPWLDIDLDNPETEKYEEVDRVLSKNRLWFSKQFYTGELSPDDYRVSPILGDISKIGDGQLTILVGTSEIFYPDCQKLLKRADEKNIQMNLYDYVDKQHIWLIQDENRRADSGYQKVVEIIRSE